MNAIVFDLEVRQGPEELPRGWDDKADMGVSCAGLYDLQSRRFRFFWGGDPEDMLELGGRIDRADYVVGFNHIGFDYAVLRGAGVAIAHRPAREVDLLTLTWDAIDRHGAGLTKRGNSLDSLCQANGLPGKSGAGAQAPSLWREGRLGRLFTYQRDDVDLTFRLLCRVARAGEITLACGASIPFALPEPFGSAIRAYLQPARVSA